jgi:peptide/nickel transport system permease protein
MSGYDPAVPDPLEPPITPQGIVLGPVLRSRGLWRDAWRSTLRSNSARVGLGLLLFLVILAVFAPVIAPYGPNEVLLSTGVTVRAKPCVHLLGCADDKPQHLMGIDGNGRDVFSRIVFGARLSLLSGVACVSVALVIGTLLGLLAGFYGRVADTVIMRCMDVLLAFPALLLAITIVTVLGRGLVNAIVAISLVTIPVYARIVRASVLSIREQDFVAADRALGVSNRRILWHRVFPNSLTPLVVQATLGIATAVLEVAALSFLGLGVQPPTAEWGSMLAAERNNVFTAFFLVLFPGIMIMINVLAFNLLGDGLRDALDPRLNK